MRALLTLVIAHTVVLAACTDEPMLAETESEVTAANKLGLNKLGLNKLGLNKLGLNKLGLNKLGLNKLGLNKLAARDLLETADGREVLSYLVSCALPEPLVLVTEIEGVTYEFPGSIGLAPHWANRSLTTEEKGWISACMISRINKFEVTVPISLRGPHEALGVTEDEADLYTVEEAAFYGDIFTPGTAPMVLIACLGEGQADGEWGQLNDRDCAEPDPAHPGLTQCGFTYAGPCADYEPPASAFACKKQKHVLGYATASLNDLACDPGAEGWTYYTKCFDEAAPHGNGAGPRFAQVITVYVHP